MTSWSNARFPKRTDDFDFGNRVTVTELLKKSGYATGHFGKWHIGLDRSNGAYGIDENDSGGRPDRLSPKGNAVKHFHGRKTGFVDFRACVKKARFQPNTN
jgi:N-acetylgalactosamine-6-sulfatase